MDPNVQWFYEKKAAGVIKALQKNRMNGVYVPRAAEVTDQVLGMIPPGASVALGGSLTISETGLLDALRASPNLELIDRYAPGLSRDEVMERLRQGLTADVFISGVNAITDDGQLFFVDATCNRVAPILFGPRRVILVAGCNKIVPDVWQARTRVIQFAAPANAHRLARKTPCAATGVCADCDSPDRICNATVVIHKQADPQRLTVVLAGESLGL
ncbi:MAG: lactate utilization protein [Deltaproteobacteria bacterium]|nr:lactate utilization protein [Deltaproteobacteria bacterium]